MAEVIKEGEGKIRYAYFKENQVGKEYRRIVCIAYQKVAEGIIRMGYCVFRKNHKDEVYNKTTHRSTALNRMLKTPQVIKYEDLNMNDEVIDGDKVPGVFSQWIKKETKRLMLKPQKDGTFAKKEDIIAKLVGLDPWRCGAVELALRKYMYGHPRRTKPTEEDEDPFASDEDE